MAVSANLPRGFCVKEAMKRAMTWTAVLATIALAAAALSGAQSRPPFPAPLPHTHRSESATCKGGCAAVQPSTDRIDESRVEELLDRQAIDELLFYADDTQAYLDKHALEYASLRRELARRTVVVSFRLVSDDGRTLLTLRHAVRLNKKYHVPPDAVDGIQPPEFSVVVQRVALDRLWSRL
jgi:hypothetical protein